MFFSPTAVCQTPAKSGVSLIKGPILQFSVDEQWIIEDIHSKFEVSWLQNFIMLDRYLLDQTQFYFLTKYIIS